MALADQGVAGIDIRADIDGVAVKLAHELVIVREIQGRANLGVRLKLSTNSFPTSTSVGTISSIDCATVAAGTRK